ncbi:MAG: hypothetical protein Q7J73_05080 [Dehalococcoidales bacterium]|nr:hypothetical protein [Dehalococcoidales bacterium]
MKFLKGLALALLGLILSLSLTVFGLAFTVNSTVLNPGFIRTEIEELDIAALVGEIVSQPSGQPQGGEEITSQAMTTAVTDTVKQLEPLLKERVTAATDSVYDYLLGKRPNPDLAVTLRSTILKTDFFVAVIDKLDITSMVKEILRDQLGSAQIPPEYQRYVDASLDKVVADIKPVIKQQIQAAADPVLDYIVGKTDNFSVTINAGQLKTSLSTAIRTAVIASPPPELAGIPQPLWQNQLDNFLQQFTQSIPSTFEINQSMFGPDFRTGITDGIQKAEDKLIQARQYVGYFQLGYTLLIVLILLSIAGIILIHRQVRGAARSLGAIFLSYGAFEYAGVLVGRYFAGKQLPSALADLPPSLQTWVTNLSDRLLSPLGTFSLAVLIFGVVLLIVSFVYPKREISVQPPTP